MIFNSFLHLTWSTPGYGLKILEALGILAVGIPVILLLAKLWYHAIANMYNHSLERHVDRTDGLMSLIGACISCAVLAPLTVGMAGGLLIYWTSIILGF